MSEPLTTPFRCGMVSIIGRPNTGKSTLLNAILKEKVAIVSRVPQTTRTQIRGIYNDERGQIIFIDTPGLHLGKDQLDQWMNKTAQAAAGETDVIIYLVDTSRPTGKEEDMIAFHLKEVRLPVILGLNKIDLKGTYVPEYISLWEKIKGKSVHDMESFVLLPLSGKTNYNVDKLLNFIFEFLPAAEPLYPVDTVCDLPIKMAIADIIREKLLALVREEVPHSLAVIVEEIGQRKNNLKFIQAQILVERESQKEIVIGKKGLVLKKVGTLAREELEGLLESKVFLSLHVKLQKNWRDNQGILEELGYHF